MIKDGRNGVLRRSKRTPSLRKSLDDPDWVEDAWTYAVQWAAAETGLDVMMIPEACPWSMSDVTTDGWLPQA